jgi:hypothetical protein
MCNFGKITVTSSSCYVEPAHVWYKVTYFLCNDNGQRCVDARQDERPIDPSPENNYAVGSRRLGPCYVCVNLAIAVKARDDALAEANEMRKRALEAFDEAEGLAWSETTEVSIAIEKYLL